MGTTPLAADLCSGAARLTIPIEAAANGDAAQSDQEPAESLGATQERRTSATTTGRRRHRA
jgi:hypothetical protein